MTYSQNNINFHYLNDSRETTTIVINKKWNEKKFKNFSFFGLFSGEMKEFIMNNFDKTLLNMIENDPNLYKILTTKNEDEEQNLNDNNNNLISIMFSNVCKELNEKLFKEMNKKMNSYECLTLGATALVCLTTPNEIYLINISDSKAILVNNDNKLKLETKQYRLIDSKEKIEIFNAIIDDNNKIYIESIDNNYYKFDYLMSTRAFGHYLFKIDHPHGFKFNNIQFKSINSIVKCEPDIQIIKRNNNNNSYLLLATSEFWNYMTNEDVIDCMNETNEKDLNIMCSNLIYKAKNQTKEITNNMSLLLITFDGQNSTNNHLSQLTSSDTLPDITRSLNLQIYSEEEEIRGNNNQFKLQVDYLKDEIKTKNSMLKEKDVEITNLKHKINQLILEKNDFSKNDSSHSSVSVFLEDNDDDENDRHEIDDDGDLDGYEYGLNENAKLFNPILMLKSQIAFLEDDIETKNNKLEKNKLEIYDLKQQIDQLKIKLKEKQQKLDDTSDTKQLEFLNDIKKNIKLKINIQI